MTDTFRLRFIATVLWSQLHANESDPKNSLRTPALKPEGSWGVGTPERVEGLTKKRAELLRSKEQAEVSEQPVSGRLLVADPASSDLCGLSVFVSGGYIDEGDVPPWDTWIHYAYQERTLPDPTAIKKTKALQRLQGNRGWEPPLHVSYLLCWVPTVFLPHVEKGIEVNPVECFFWASEYKERHYNTALLRQLDVDGLLG